MGAWENPLSIRAIGQNLAHSAHAGGCHQQPTRRCSALVLSPKAPLLWITGAHRGARRALDEFKAACDVRRPHDGGLPKILGGNLVPAAVADRRIGLQPYAPSGRGWLVGNLTCMIDRHTVLQEGQIPPKGNMRSCQQHRMLPSPSMAISIPPLATSNLSFTCKNA